MKLQFSVTQEYVNLLKMEKPEVFHFHNYLGLFNLVLLEVPLAAFKALGSWVSLYKLCKHEQFIPFFLIDPLKLCQIGRAASLNCHRQVFPQMMHEPCLPRMVRGGKEGG